MVRGRNEVPEFEKRLYLGLLVQLLQLDQLEPPQCHTCDHSIFCDLVLFCEGEMFLPIVIIYIFIYFWIAETRSFGRHDSSGHHITFPVRECIETVFVCDALSGNNKLLPPDGYHMISLDKEAFHSRLFSGHCAGSVGYSSIQMMVPETTLQFFRDCFGHCMHFIHIVFVFDAATK